MSNEGRLRAALNRAADMKALSEGPGGFFELMELLENEWLDQWRETAVDDVRKREAIFAHCKVLRAIRQSMAAVIADGKISEAELEMLRKIDAGEMKDFSVI